MWEGWDRSGRMGEPRWGSILQLLVPQGSGGFDLEVDIIVLGTISGLGSTVVGFRHVFAED